MPKILAFSGHLLATFQPILDCFIPMFKLKYEDSENIKADRVNTAVFNLRQIKRRAFYLGLPVEELNKFLFGCAYMCCIPWESAQYVT